MGVVAERRREIRRVGLGVGRDELRAKGARRIAGRPDSIPVCGHESKADLGYSAGLAVAGVEVATTTHPLVLELTGKTENMRSVNFPAHPRLSDEDVEDVIAYLVTLK